MSIYRELFKTRVITALGAANAAKGLTHRGLKGEIVEILIRDLFTPLLPSDVGIATGLIIESFSDKQSTQQDIILYDKSILPPILYDGVKGIIPIESVLYTIEVKSILNAQAIKQAHEAAKYLHGFRYRPGYLDAHGKEFYPPDKPIIHNIPVVFALKSDLSQDSPKSEAERYRDIYDVDGGPQLGAICVAGKEYWYEGDGSWVKCPGSECYDETIAFIGGITNTYKQVAASRGQPKLGHYLIKNPDSHITYPSGTKPTINVQCESCGAIGVCYFNNSKERFCDYPDGFKSPDKCMKCGGNLVAPSGKYENVNGLFVKIGDC